MPTFRAVIGKFTYFAPLLYGIPGGSGHYVALETMRYDYSEGVGNTVRNLGLLQHHLR